MKKSNKKKKPEIIGVIKLDYAKVSLGPEYTKAVFRTGTHKGERDRPRTNWKKWLDDD